MLQLKYLLKTVSFSLVMMMFSSSTLVSNIDAHAETTVSFNIDNDTIDTANYHTYGDSVNNNDWEYLTGSTTTFYNGDARKCKSAVLNSSGSAYQSTSYHWDYVNFNLHSFNSNVYVNSVQVYLNYATFNDTSAKYYIVIGNNETCPLNTNFNQNTSPSGWGTVVTNKTITPSTTIGTPTKTVTGFELCSSKKVGNYYIGADGIKGSFKLR